MWEEGIDYYFFIDDASKEIFRQRFTHTKANLKTVFFPLSSEYFIERSKINSKHILIILSSLKKDFVDNFLSILKDSSKTLTIVQWRNPQLYKKMYQKYSHISQFHFFEYLSLKDYYKEVDICVSKPGWATISECIASEIPLLIPDFIPGQEEGNKILIEKNEIWIYEANPLKAVFLLNYIDWSKMLPNFKKIKNPHACEDIIKYLS